MVMLKLFDKDDNVRYIVEKNDLYKTYRVTNTEHVNLQNARVFFDIFDGLYLIKARGDSGYISVVIAFWSGNYSGTSSPDIIFVYNKGFSYTASNNTGTIAFDMACNTIDVIPLMNV